MLRTTWIPESCTTHLPPSGQTLISWPWLSCRETHGIGRYICTKHKLESLYPEDFQKRALVDAQLDWQLASLYPCIRTHLYEHIGFAGPSSGCTS